MKDWSFERYRKQPHNGTDLENAPETSGSVSEPLAYVDVSEDLVTIRLQYYADGELQYKLDDEASFRLCCHGYKIHEVSTGRHFITFQFTPIGSSQPLYQPPYEFIIRPTIIDSIITHKDTATIDLDTKPSEVDGTFEYSLDDKEFQQCSSGDTLSKLSAGTHHIVFRFIPTDSPDAFSVSNEYQFEIEPIAQACGPISVIEDTATIQLYSNTEGTFKYSLNGAVFQQCFPATKFSRLTPGIHKIIVCFIASSSHKEIPCFSDSFKVGQTDHPVGPPSIPPKLQNFGNTCFFNAALQGMISTSEFYTLDVMTVYRVPIYRVFKGSTLEIGTYTKQYVVPSKTCDDPLEIEVTSRPGPLTVSLDKLLWKVHESSFLVPRDLLTQLGKRNSRFTRGTQEDSHEALRCIFDALKAEEIQPLKEKINESTKNLDDEENLKMKGYLRMAIEVLTAIGKVIEGKTISVTICHECHEATEVEEPFFDISLPMPGEDTFKKETTGNFSHTKLNHSQVETNHSSKNERKKTNNKIFPESGSQLQSPTSAAMPDKSIKHKEESIANAPEDTDSMPSNKGTESNVDKNGNNLTEQNTHKSLKVTDIDSMISEEVEGGKNVEKQQAGDIQGTQMDLCTDALATKLEGESVSQYNTANLDVIHHLLQMAINKTKSRKDSDLRKDPNDEPSTTPGAQSTDEIEAVDSLHTNSHGANVIAKTADQQHSTADSASKNSDKITAEKNVPNSSMTFTVALIEETVNSSKDTCTNLSTQQSVEENSRSLSVQHSAFPVTKEVKQDIHQKDTEKEGVENCQSNATFRSVAKDKDAFQQYLVQKGLNYLTEANKKLIAHYDLQHSLFEHTDFDVLDEENKFICRSCEKNQQNLNDKPMLCQVSKQIMIHQLPPVLILHMKRFELGYQITKDNRHISFPEILNMTPYCTVKCLKDLGDSEDKILYGLYAVVVHSGRTLHGGHYTAYVKTERPTKEKKTGNVKNGRKMYDTGYCEKGQWYYTSDTTVMRCSFEDVKRSEAYMLFYERLPLITD